MCLKAREWAPFLRMCTLFVLYVYTVCIYVEVVITLNLGNSLQILTMDIRGTHFFRQIFGELSLQFYSYSIFYLNAHACEVDTYLVHEFFCLSFYSTIRMFYMKKSYYHPSMLLIMIDENYEIGAHVRSNLCY